MEIANDIKNHLWHLEKELQELKDQFNQVIIPLKERVETLASQFESAN